MNTNLMRQEVAKAYVGPGWAEKVKKMSDQQLFAVYTRLKKKGIIK